jgi:DNA-binding CsgD family transcriptional regulator
VQRALRGGFFLGRGGFGEDSREQEVLSLLSSGYHYKEISDRLGIGIETVRTHVKNICEKMHVRNRVEAVTKHGQR